MAALTFKTQAVLPWNELLTYTSVRASGDVTETRLKGSRYPIRLGEVMASGGVYSASDVVFTFDADDLTDTGSKPADTVTTADGTVYTVLTSVVAPFLKFVKVTTRNLILAYDLRDTMTVQRPANSQDSNGLRVTTLTNVSGATSIPCRVQEVASEVDLAQFGAATHDRDFVVYVGQRLYLKAGDVLNVAGTLYDFRGSASWDRIDQHGEIRVRRREG